MKLQILEGQPILWLHCFQIPLLLYVICHHTFFHVLDVLQTFLIGDCRSSSGSPKPPRQPRRAAGAADCSSGREPLARRAAARLPPRPSTACSAPTRPSAGDAAGGGRTTTSRSCPAPRGRATAASGRGCAAPAGWPGSRPGAPATWPS